MPTADEFRDLLMQQPLDAVVDQFLFGPDTFAFRTRPAHLTLLWNHLEDGLGVPRDRFTVVGSAKLGFSLSPDTFPRRFSARSDIDVVVVSDQLFDAVWVPILKWQYPRRWRFTKEERERLEDLYWGWIAPQRLTFDLVTVPAVLVPVHALRVRWFNVFRSLGRYHQFAAREISGRLFRTWDHARLYYADSLRKLQERLRPAPGQV